MGQIYKITNLVNGKIYIGQTGYDFISRFKGHVKDSKYKDKQDYPLYAAFRKYGLANFTVELVEEIYYIEKYGSYHNGYNQTLGGGGNKTVEIDHKLVLDSYTNTKSIAKTAKQFDVSTSVIKKILVLHGITIENKVDNTEVGLIQLEQTGYSIEITNEFSSKADAYKWIIDNYKSDMKKSTFYYYCKRAYERYTKAFGYYWITSDDDINSAIDKIQYSIQNFGNSTLKSIPDMDTLFNVYINCNKNKEAIGRYFGVTGTTVIRWLRKYGIE